MNLALKKPCYQTGRYYSAYPSRAVDGNMVLYSCPSKGYNRYWYVNLQKDVSIDAVVIFPYPTARYYTLNVYVGFTTNSFELCRQIKRPPVGKTFIVTCSSNNKGRFVKIHRPDYGYVEFNEVEIYGKII